MDHDSDDPRKYPAGAGSSDGPADNESVGGRGRTTDDGAELKDADSSQKNPFRRVEGINAADKQLEGSLRKHIGASVPANVAQRMELIRHAWNSCSNDSTILSVSK